MHNPGEMNSERHYFALIGDIIDSRHEQDRYDVQKKLQSILSSVNAEHAAHIAADFLITLGDEFQGLLFAEKGADPIFVADRIIDEMFPVRIRIAIGFGGMATQIRSGDWGGRRSVLPCAERNEFAQESRKPRQSIFKNSA